MSSNIILLTYKGKALLMHKQKSVIDPEHYPWSFIGSNIPERKESIEKALTRSVQKEMGIKIENIKYISKSFYHAKLTDENVNNIKRSEHQLLDFFNLEEIKKLSLSISTQEFIEKHGLIDVVPRPGYNS